MLTNNFNLLDHAKLSQLGFSETELAEIDDLRPLPNLFHLSKIDSISSERIGQLIQQGIVVSPGDMQLVPDDRVRIVTDQELAEPEVACLCGDLGDLTEEADGSGIGLWDPSINLGEDPFGIFEPLNPKRILKVGKCEDPVAVPLVGLGKVRLKVSLQNLKPREELRRVVRAVEFVGRLGRVRARGALVKAILKIFQNARKICTSPKCPDPSITFGPQTVEEVFSLVLPATRPDGAVRDGVFVIYALYLAKQTLTIQCTKRPGS